MTAVTNLVAPIVATVEHWQTAGLLAGEPLAKVRERLESPLRVAVAGRVSTGKSTIVNALLHKAAAATGAGEVTRLVSFFHHGFPERVTVVSADTRLDLQRVHFPLDDTLALPRRLDPRRISHLDVTLPLERMQSLTVVDTPGLQSANQSTSEGTGRVLGFRGGAFDDGADRVAAADAIIYVVNQDVRADDNHAIDEFVAATGGGPASHVRVVAVLNRADRCGGLASPECTRLRNALAGRFGGRVVDVVPMVANLAETALAGRFTQSMIDDLIGLSRLDRTSADVIWHDVAYFQDEAGLETSRAAALVERLGLHGIRLAVALIQSGVQDVRALHSALVTASGMDRLVEHLDRLAGRGEVLKARWALDALSRLAWASGAPQVRDEIAELRGHERFDVIEELDVLDALMARTVTVDDVLEAQAIATLSPGSDDERLDRLGQPSRADLEAWMNRWLQYENTCSTPSQAAAARQVHRRLGRLRGTLIGLCRTNEVRN